MTIQIQRSTSLKAIVLYKGLGVLSLTTISIVSALSWKHYDALLAFIENYVVEGEAGLTDWLLKTVIDSQPDQLSLIAQLSGLYAIALGTVTVGLWHGKRWASLLMIGMAGLPLPIEILELLQHPDWLRFIIPVLNIAVVGYLVQHQLAPTPPHLPHPPHPPHPPHLSSSHRK